MTEKKLANSRSDKGVLPSSGKVVSGIADIRSSITVIDNFSAAMSRFVSGSNRVTESAERMQERLRVDAGLEEQIQRQALAVDSLGDRYAKQCREVERLTRLLEEEKSVASARSAQTEALKQRLNDATLKMIKYADALDTAGAKLDKLYNAAEKMSEGANKAAEKQEKMNRKMHEGTGAADSLTRKLKGLLGAYLGFRGLKKGFEATVGAAAQLGQQSMMIQAAFGDMEVGEAYFKRLQKFAVQSGQKIEELSQVTRNFMQLTKNTDKLIGLTELANRLSLRTESIGSAEVLMQEAIRGQYTRLQRTLHLTDSQLAPLKEAIQAGSLEGIIAAFDEALNIAGLTKEIVRAFQESPLQKFNRILADFKQRFARSGEKALERLVPVLDRVDGWLQSDNATRFFNAISIGIAGITNGLVFLFDLAQRNWPIVKAILVSISSVLLANIIRSLWAMIPPLVAQAIAWMAPLWPIVLVMAAIGLFVALLIHLGVKTEEITGFIGGLFGLLWVGIYNGVAFVWNTMASFAEFLVNLFIDPVYAIEKLFFDLSINMVKAFDSAIQAIVSGINLVIRLSNKFLKTNFKEVQLDYVTNYIAKLEENAPTSKKEVRKAARLEYKDYAEEFTRGYDIGKAIPDRIREGVNSITDAINDLTNVELKWNALQLDTLGAINDKQMTEEDLKWLRDAAEQEVINRFTAATLAPQMTFHFGDVRETADIDGIVDRVEHVMTELLNTTAEGVHA